MFKLILFYGNICTYLTHDAKYYVKFDYQIFKNITL